MWELVDSKCHIRSSSQEPVKASQKLSVVNEAYQIFHTYSNIVKLIK